MTKLYTAFVSSVYESLKDERKVVIDCLLDYRVYPLCMEHFVTSTNQNFNEIKDLIDDSDFMLLILGSEYGSCDSQGISWTEREYDYAMESETEVLAIICDELLDLRTKRKNAPETLTESELKQLKFTDKISYAVPAATKQEIGLRIGQFLSRDLSHFPGWTRRSSIMFNTKKLASWREENKAYDLSGTWYHAHLSPDDPTYIRIGTITITQSFDPENYKQLTFNGFNYNLIYNNKTDTLQEDIMKRTHWTGTYDLDDVGTMFGIFQAKREFMGTFNDQNVGKGNRRGIHDFSILSERNMRTDSFHGEFHDEAPSPKSGYIYVFRTKDQRDEFIKTNYPEVLDHIIANKK